MKKHYTQIHTTQQVAQKLVTLVLLLTLSLGQVIAQGTTFYEPFKLTTSFYNANNSNPTTGTDLHYRYDWRRQNLSNPNVTSRVTNSQLELLLSPPSTSDSSIFYTETFFFFGNLQQEIRFVAKQNNNAGGNNVRRLLKISVVNPDLSAYTPSNPLADTLKVVRFANASAQSQNVVIVNNLNVTGQYRLKVEFELTQTSGNGNGNNIPTMEISQFQTDLSLLPVNYSMLSAKQVFGTVQLNWTTSMEENNSHFDVEHSVDGENWDQIGSVEGVGFSTEQTAYAYTHLNPLDGGNLYRLRQVDFDGSAAYSKVLFVLFNKRTEEQIQIFPNPSTGKVNLIGTSQKTISVFNINGNLVYEGNYSNQLDLEFLKHGFYFMHIEGLDGEIKKIRFLKE